MIALDSTFFWPIITWFSLGLLVSIVARIAGTLTMLEFLFCLVAWPAIIYLTIVRGIEREQEHQRRLALYKRAMKDVEDRLEKACRKAGVDPKRIKRIRRW